MITISSKVVNAASVTQRTVPCFAATIFFSLCMFVIFSSSRETHLLETLPACPGGGWLPGPAPASLAWPGPGAGAWWLVAGAGQAEASQPPATSWPAHGCPGKKKFIHHSSASTLRHTAESYSSSFWQTAPVLICLTRTTVRFNYRWTRPWSTTLTD